MAGAGLWRVALESPDAASADAASRAFDLACSAVSAFELVPGGAWQVEGLSLERPDRAMIEAALALAWPGNSGEPPAPDIERVPPQDWLAQNQASFAPIAIGRYFVHGAHHPEVPEGRIGLLVEAATAFGTGEHATTRGCLLALDRLARRRRPRRILDMGTGTGILAIAAAKTWHRRIHARDIESESVRVAAHNARRNGVGTLIDAAPSDGFRHRALRRAAPFDLILANILARPLELMARDLSRALAPGGIAILSGLLARQEPDVLAAYRHCGLALRNRIAIEGWHTLMLDKGAAHRPLHSERS